MDAPPAAVVVVAFAAVVAVGVAVTHGPHSDHSDMRQSTGHAGSTHDSSSTARDGHGVPPPSASRSTVSERDRFPVPHSPVHAVHAPSVTSQSTTQTCVLQLTVSCNIGHTEPPCWGCVVTTRCLSCVPPPQGAEQLLHWLQGVTEQSTGHGCSLHTSLRNNGGQGVPLPEAATVTLRTYNRCPPPHVAVHSSASLQLLTWQSTLTGGASGGI